MSSTIPAVPWPLPEYKSLADVELEQLRLALAANRATLAGYAVALANAQADLRELRGENLMVEPGCEHATLRLDGDCTAVVAFCRGPREPADETGHGGPGQIFLEAAYINGNWIDVSEFSDNVLDRWVEQIAGDA